MKSASAAALLVLLTAALSAQAERHIYVADHSVKKVFKLKEDGKMNQANVTDAELS